MPTYSYACNKCKKNFELFCSIKDYTDAPQCTHCQSKKTYRRYVDDLLTLSSSVKKSDSELKTIGDLAKRNSERMSDDQKQHLQQKHNSYKETKEEKPLPKGMEYTKKPKTKIKWT